MKRSTLLVLLSYLTIYIVWGSTYFFIKMAVETIPPFYVIALRWLIGGILFLLFAIVSGRLRQFPTLRQVGASVFLGFTLLVAGNGLITFAEQRVDSYLVALILASTPILVAFYDWILIKKRIAPMALIGIMIGLVGVGLLLYDGRSLGTSFSPSIWMVIGGLAFWSLGTSLGHKLKVHPDIIVNSAVQMTLVGATILTGLYLCGQSLTVDVSTVTASSSFGLWYLAIVGSLAFIAYNYLIAHEPAIRIVSYAFVNPLIAVVLGLMVGNEKPVPYLAAGLPLILSGLFLMLYGETLAGTIKKLCRIS